jgi:hypothetical protein
MSTGFTVLIVCRNTFEMELDMLRKLLLNERILLREDFLAILFLNKLLWDK